MTDFTFDWKINGLLILLLFFLSFYYYMTKDFNYWNKRNVPNVSPTPFFGNILPIIALKKSVSIYMEELYRKSKSLKSKFIGFWILGQPSIFISDLDLMKHMLVKDFQHFADRVVASKSQNDTLGRHMIFGMKHPHWKNMRSRISPMFTMAKIKTMYQHMSDNSEKLINYIELLLKRSDSNVLGLKDILAKYTVDNIMCATLGFTGDCLPKISDNELEFKDSPVFEVALSLVADTPRRVLEFSSFFIVPELIHWVKFKFFNTFASDFIRKLFWKAVEQRTKNGERGTKGDFLDKLISFKDTDLIVDGLKYDDDVLVAQFAVLLAAGFETSSTSMALTLHHLAWNPEKQTRLRDEITEVIAEHGGKITYDSLLEMPYLDMVYKEILRLYPTLPFIDRLCIKDYEVPDSDLVIKKGTKVYFSLSAIHRDSDYWSDPDVFDPERFSSENKGEIVPFSYIPFGEGPRICIGERVGVFQSKLGLAKILMNYKVERMEDTSENVILSQRTILVTPQTPLNLKFVKCNA